jgi:hypothetical protein
MRQPYLGNLNRAHRLNAARRSAGLPSVTEAAVRFGWSLATYRAHEGATRRMNEDAAGRYASAFGVPFEWLWDGRGDGPAVDPIRVDKYLARAKHEELRLRDDPAEWGFLRLRVARRLAGFRTVTDAADHIGLARSTLASHEAGQNRISREAATIYSTIFGIHADWLLTGALPSGFDPNIERVLNRLIQLHHAPEGVARKQFPSPRRSPPASVPETPPAATEAKPRHEDGDLVPEFSPETLLRWLGDDHRPYLSGAPAQRTWRFPAGFLSGSMSCDPAYAVVVVAAQNSMGSRRGDRIVVDTSARSALPGGIYALIGGDGMIYTVLIDADRPIETELYPRRSWWIIGKACGIVGGMR